MQSKSSSLAPYIAVKDARAAIDFYCKAFGAEEIFALTNPSDGRIGHAELKFGDVTLMISDEFPDFGALSPDTIGGSPVKLYIRVDNVDEIFARALDLGGIETRPVKDQFFGERSGALMDPFGHTWFLSMKIEDVSPQEMQRRWTEAMEG